jgi:Rod binding domain-containing protein
MDLSLTPLPYVPSTLAIERLPAERLAQNATLKEPERIQELSRQFEALLLRQILKEARKTVVESGLFETSTATDIYHDMVNNQLAESISRSGTFGLARQLQQELSRQAAANPDSADTSHEP